MACLPPGSLLLSLLAIGLIAAPRAASAQTLDAPTSSSRSLRLLSGAEPLASGGEIPELHPRRTNLDELGMRVYLTYYGLTRGVIHGAMLSLVFPSDTKAYTGIMAVVGGVGETVVNHLLISSEEMTPGRAHVITMGLDFGLLAGFAFDLAKDVEFDWDSAERSQTFFMIPLALSVGGAIASGVLVDARTLTWGDMEFVYMSGLVGTAVGAAVLAQSEQSAGLGALLGSGLGLVAGSFLIQGRDFSVGHGLLLDVGAVAGALGGGVTATAVGSEDQAIAISAGLGAALGMGITYALLSPYAEQSVLAAAAPVDFSLQFVPGSFAARDTRTGRPSPTSLLLQGRF